VNAPALRWWQQPSAPIPHQVPRQPCPGVAPVMVTAPSGHPSPLVTHAVHRLFRGFTTATVHPLDEFLQQCSGCWCWLTVPRKPRPLAVAR